MHKPTTIPFQLAALLTLFLLGGCFRYQPMSGSPHPAEPLGEGAWVTMDTQPLRPLLEMPAAIDRYVFDVDRLPTIWKKTDEDIEAMRRIHTHELVLSRLDEHGLIRIWRRQQGKAINTLPTATDKKPGSFDRNGRYLTAALASWYEREREIEAEYGGGRGMRFPSRSIYGLLESDFAANWKLDEGLQLAVPEVVEDDPAGLIIHITGMFETKYEQSMTNRLRAHGYAAAYLESDPFLRSPREEEREIRFALREKRSYELMDEALGESGASLTDFEKNVALSSSAIREIFKRVNEEIPPIRGFAITPETDIEAHGRAIAALSDELIATHAYAGEAMVRASEQLHPVLMDKPIIVIGYSAGALSAPAVTARLAAVYPGRPIRMILVGGGGDLISIAAQSSLGDMFMNFAPVDGPEPTDEQIAALSRAYLAHSRLDPLVLAKSLRAIPTLHLYAAKDRAVPTAAAERFNAAHGHVDRLVHPWNHGTLFYFLQGEAGKVRSWLREHGVE